MGWEGRRVEDGGKGEDAGPKAAAGQDYDETKPMPMPGQSCSLRCVLAPGAPCWLGMRRRGRLACRCCALAIRSRSSDSSTTGRDTNSPVMCLWRPVVSAKVLGAMWALADNLECGRGALCRVGSHLGLALGSGLAVLGDGGDVVDDAELAALLGGPAWSQHRARGW